MAALPDLSRQELAQAICAHLHWNTPGGGNWVKAALGLLERLAWADILRLPPKRAENMRRGRCRPLVLTPRSEPQPPLTASPRDS